MCAAAPCTMAGVHGFAEKIMTTPNEALRTILPIAGWGDGQAADVVFTGGADPVLPTPFRIGAAVPQLSPQAGSQPRRCGRLAPGGGSACPSTVARPRQRCRAALAVTPPPRTAAARRSGALAHARARPYPRPRGTGLCPDAGRAWRGSPEDHRSAATERRVPGIGYWARQACGAPRSARAGRCRYPARAGAQGRCLLARISSWHLGQPRLVARGAVRDPAGTGLRFALCLRSRRPLGVKARLRHGGANRQRHDDTSGGERPGQDSGATILPGLGDRLLHRLLDGIWRDGG